jgi:beta-ribofuranosylaminobenzene 5'-phosphate synthase
VAPATRAGGAVVVRSYPRVHVGLLDLGHVTRRRHGGAGFTLGGPCLEVTAEAGGPLEVRGLERYDERARQEVDHALDAFQRTAGPLGARLTLTQALPQHVGLGSKTALLLTVLRAASEVAERPPEPADLPLLTGRGGTSGIGVNSFFSGGFLTDGGHPAAPALPFGPSSAGRPDRVPPPLCRLAVPAGWRFTLLLPRCARLSDDAERRVFSRHTPLPETEVLRAIATLYHGIVPAVATDDLALLEAALADFHGLGFKARELAVQPAPVRHLYAAVRRVARPVGLSSMGPLLYVITAAGESDVRATVERLALEHDCDLLGTHEPRNAGFDVRRVR